MGKGVVLVTGFLAESLGLGVVEDNYDADSDPGKHERVRLMREGGYASSRCQPVQAGVRAYNKIYKLVDGEQKFDHVEILEAYHKQTKSGRRSSRISWRVVDTIPAHQFDPSTMDKTLLVLA